MDRDLSSQSGRNMGRKCTYENLIRRGVIHIEKPNPSRRNGRDRDSETSTMAFPPAPRLDHPLN
ncbi:MAG: hypothetical protein LAT80_14950, partial [Balneolaceae bacterium]|nr:hypothetical protein [Balneolaceae bacterium]